MIGYKFARWPNWFKGWPESSKGRQDGSKVDQTVQRVDKMVQRLTRQFKGWTRWFKGWPDSSKSGKVYNSTDKLTQKFVCNICNLHGYDHNIFLKLICKKIDNASTVKFSVQLIYTRGSLEPVLVTWLLLHCLGWCK
jgi:hypothetical protein